jgi:lipopolysaccharide export system permease protein
LPDRPEDFFIPEYKQEETPLSSNLQEARLAQPEQRREAMIKLNLQLSYIFLGIPLVLLGLPILIVINQRWRRDLSVAIPVSCILAFTAWGWWSAAQALLKVYPLDPTIVSWSLHLLAGGLGLLILKKQDI